jgi:hypothetical protein
MIFIAVSRPAEIIFGHAIPFPGLGGKEEENKVSRKKNSLSRIYDFLLGGPVLQSLFTSAK